MAGSLAHMVDDKTGELRMDLLENMRDASEALDECFHIILELTGGNKAKINAVCKKLSYPSIKADMRSE